MLMKDGWRFPSQAHDSDTGVKVPVAVGFDNDPDEYLVSEGRGYTGVDEQGTKFPTVDFLVAETQDGQTDAFFEKFSHADHMWIKFKAGNEKTMMFDMVGSRNAVNAWYTCMRDIAKQNDSQPYDQGADSVSAHHPRKLQHDKGDI
jgi:hypothetical protein